MSDALSTTTAGSTDFAMSDADEGGSRPSQPPCDPAGTDTHEGEGRSRLPQCPPAFEIFEIESTAWFRDWLRKDLEYAPRGESNPSSRLIPIDGYNTEYCGLRGCREIASIVLDVLVRERMMRFPYEDPESKCRDAYAKEVETFRDKVISLAQLESDGSVADRSGTSLQEIRNQLVSSADDLREPMLHASVTNCTHKVLSMMMGHAGSAISDPKGKHQGMSKIRYFGDMLRQHRIGWAEQYQQVKAHFARRHTHQTEAGSSESQTEFVHCPPYLQIMLPVFNGMPLPKKSDWELLVEEEPDEATRS